MSRAERRAMVERDHPALSLSRQCRLLSIGRSSLYYTSRGESAETLALMRRIDELFLKYPFYGARQMVRHLRREGVRIGRRRAGRLMRLMGLQAVYRAPRTSEAHPERRVYPYLLKGLEIERANQVWCADITYIQVRRGFLYLVAVMDWASRHVLAWRLSNTLDAGFSSRRSTRRWPAMARRSSSIPTRAASSPASPSPGTCGRPVSGYRWTAGAGAWTTSSSSGCGVRSNTRPSICASLPTFEARRVIGEWIGFYNTERPHSALGGRTPAEAYRGDPPVDMMVKPLRALTTSPQAQQQRQEDRSKGMLVA